MGFKIGEYDPDEDNDNIFSKGKDDYLKKLLAKDKGLRDLFDDVDTIVDIKDDRKED